MTQKQRIYQTICELLDIIEQESPEVYYKSNEVMRADDLLVELENEPDLQEFIKEIS